MAGLKIYRSIYKIGYIFSVIVMLLLSSCDYIIKGYGDFGLESYDVYYDATKIEVNGTMRLILSDNIKPGSLDIRAQENIFKYIDVSSGINGKVVVDMAYFNNYDVLEIDVYASSQQFSQIVASGMSEVENRDSEVFFENYSIELSGASEYEGYLNIDNELYISASGSSELEIYGYCNKCVVDMSGESEMDGSDFECNYLDVNMAGATFMDMYVYKSIYGFMSGSSKLLFRGGRSTYVNVERYGSSSIIEY